MWVGRRKKDELLTLLQGGRRKNSRSLKNLGDSFIMLKSKTLWAGVAGVVSALSGYLTGELELGAALNVGITAILAIFVRHGVSKVEKKVEG